MSTAIQLPHWDMADIFPGLDSKEFDEAFYGVIDEVAKLAELFDRVGVKGENTIEIDESTIDSFEEVVDAFNGLEEQLHTVYAYISSFVNTNSFDNLAQAKQSELVQQMVRLSQLETRLIAWFGSLDVDALVRQSDRARAIEFTLRKAKVGAEHLMPQPEEDLAAELSPSGGTAWSRLHSDVWSQIIVPVELNGQVQELAMSVVRNLAYEADRDVRRRAYEAELDAWKRVATPLAAALNSIKGEANTLEKRRGWDSVLDYSLFDNNIDRRILDAMMSAARDSFPDFRLYMQAKARALGIDRLAWYDIFAPVAESGKVWEYEDGRNFLLEQFGRYSPRLRAFAARAYDRNWIDAEPRPGKVGGAYCMSIRPGESRVLTNYMPTYDGVSTLAHELGHAYHNFNLVDRTILQRNTPMTLAETASIFCETIIEHAALEGADRDEQLAILEASLQGSCQVVVDITSRFLFEKGVLERRPQRELSVDELNELMLETQRETYGDGLDQNVLHPYMWAVKTHYYRRSESFYNYPYMFGLLFGLGLYARFQKEPDSFRAGYDDLLSSTGLADAATLAHGFGIDIRDEAFWRSSFDIIRDNVARFEQLVTEREGARA